MTCWVRCEERCAKFKLLIKLEVFLTAYPLIFSLIVVVFSPISWNWWSSEAKSWVERGVSHDVGGWLYLSERSRMKNPRPAPSLSIPDWFIFRLFSGKWTARLISPQCWCYCCVRSYPCTSTWLVRDTLAICWDLFLLTQQETKHWFQYGLDMSQDGVG